MRINIILRILLIFCTFIIIESVSAQTSTSDATLQESYYREQYTLLRDQAKEFKEDIKHERDMFYASMATVIGLLTLFGIGGVLSIKNEAKKAFQSEIEKETDTLKHDINIWAEDKLYDEFGLNKKILILADKKRHKQLNAEEKQLLLQRHFKNVEVVGFQSDIKSADIIIFDYSQHFDKELSRIVDKLMSQNKKIPLIIYSLETVVTEKFKSYKYRAGAKSQLTLVSWVFTISSSYKNLI